jgi:hypothetical protein
MAISDIKYNYPGKNKSSPDHPLAVRIANGEEFVSQESDLAIDLQARLVGALEHLLCEQRITNLHLSKITNEVFTEEDIE